jgi:hypothetical protein
LLPAGLTIQTGTAQAENAPAAEAPAADAPAASGGGSGSSQGLDLQLRGSDWQEDEWNHALRLNGWLPSVNGTVGVRGVVTDIDLSISEILDHLNMTFQTSFAARRGRWGFAADLFYVKLSGGTAKETTSLISSLVLDIKMTSGEGTAFYRAMDWDGGRGFLDVGAGARVFGLDLGLASAVTTPGSTPSPQVSRGLPSTRQPAISTTG